MKGISKLGESNLAQARNGLQKIIKIDDFARATPATGSDFRHEFGNNHIGIYSIIIEEWLVYGDNAYSSNLLVLHGLVIAGEHCKRMPEELGCV